jgi:hypothetical protein
MVEMRTNFIILLICGFFGFTSYGSSYCNEPEKTLEYSDVAYIEPWQIHVLPEGLFVEIEGVLYQINALFYDQNGYSIPYAGWWKCKNGHYNAPWISICTVCGERKP